MYIEVLFNLPLEGPFTYEAEDDSPADLGFRVEAFFGRRKLIGFVIRRRTDPPSGDFTIKPIKRVVDKEPFFTQVQVDLAFWMAGTYFCTPGEALSAMLPGGKRESASPALGGYDLPGPRNISLSDEQNQAVTGILSRTGGDLYLYGITGSGKTEVFLSAAQAVLDQGQGCLYLVPEIALTRQLVVEVEARFGEGTAILHSRLTPSQRYAQWMKILKGESRFVIGARSAIFAPVRNLGLIVIDEEHEGSYKSDATPRYHARQVAMRRGRIEHCRVVMGSATPSLEAYHLARQGGMIRHDLTRRLSGGELPEIKVVDMKKETGVISKTLAAALRRVEEEGRQSILFLNRRGFSTFFHCRSCGYEMVCRHCSVGLTYHKNRNRMVCHYCGFNQAPVDVCPSCGSLDVGYAGFGTEAVEEELRRLFPDIPATRMDTDTVSGKGNLEEKLEEFRSGRTRLLLGTQMVAKGLNFPGVKLVGIILADTGLHLPDFRAAERSFALMHQVAGRAGRYTRDGEVIIQTYRPDHPAVTAAARGSLEEFYDKELETRKALGFPPYTRLFRITLRGKDSERVKNGLELLARGLRELREDCFELLGPAECPLSLISGNYRHHFLVRTSAVPRTRALLREVLSRWTPPPGTHLEVDPDPVNLL